MAQPLNRTDLLGTNLVWCLSLTYAGRVYRWASAHVAPVDDAGVSYHFAGGLDPVELSEQFSGQNSDPDQLSLPFAVWFPPGDSVAALVAAGHDLGAATAEVALWVNGTSWDRRRIVLPGSVIEPEYGGDQEPVSFSVEQNPWDDAALLPAAQAMVTSTTWPAAPEDSLGLYYPIIFGRPGQWADAVTSGSPGIPVSISGSDVNTILLAGHEVAAATVILFYDDSYLTGTVQHVYDTLGQRVAVLDISGETSTVRQASEYWIGWRGADEGGLWNPTHTGTMTGAGDLLVWLLRRSSLPVDLGRWAAVRAQLNRYQVSGYVDDVVSPWAYVQDNLLPLLPVDIRSGPGGMYPVLWRFDAVSSDAVEHIVAGPGVVRTGQVTYSKRSGIQNQIRLSYALRARKNSYKVTRVITAATDTTTGDIGSYLATISQSRYGVRELGIETDVIYDDATAGLITAWMLRAYALPSRTITYEVGQEYAWLAPGDVLTLTDAELVITGQVCLLQQIDWHTDGGLALTVLIMEQPARDRRG